MPDFFDTSRERSIAIVVVERVDWGSSGRADRTSRSIPSIGTIVPARASERNRT